MSYGVFRPDPRPWRLYSARHGAAGSAAAPREQGGGAVGVSGGEVTPVKVAAVGGSCSAAAAASGAASRVTAVTGTTVTAGTGATTPAKQARPVTPAVAVATGQATYARTSPQGGVVAAVAMGQSRLATGQRAVGVAVAAVVELGKLVATQGPAATAAASTGSVGRIAAQGGTCAGSATGNAQAGRRAPAGGVAAGTGTVTVRFAARVGGAGIALGAPTGAPRKRVSRGGPAVCRPTTSGRVEHRAPVIGTASATASGDAQAVRRIPVAGHCGGLAATRSFPVVPGPTTGTRVSPPLGVPDGPIAGSLIVWTATLDGGGLLVETSIDGGITWQQPFNGGPVPRLTQGDTRTARTVLTRVTLTRTASDAPSPRLHRLEVEVAVDSSREELCPVGVFTLNEVDVADTANGLVIEMAGADLSRRVSRNRWDDTYVIEAGTNYATAIQDLIRNRMPDVTFNFTATVRTTPRLFFGEQSSNDPWQDAQDMATSIGCELFFDARGVCTLRPEPDPDVDASVWEFTDQARPTIIDLHRRVTDENTYNKVIATGEGTSNEVPVRGEAIDDDPSSPTYYLGPYGTVTDRFTSPMITTQEQAQDAANARLLRVKGATEAVELEVVPMPALEPGDVVTVTRGRSKVEGRFLLDQIKIPLGPQDPMRAVGRRQRI